MAKTLSDLRPVHVVGIGRHRYQPASETSFVTLGLTAVREALSDAGLSWPSVGASYVATTTLGLGAGGAMLRYLGATGLPTTQIENASASGSAAFRLACMDVASGMNDIALAVGVDKAAPLRPARKLAGIVGLADDLVAPMTQFALLAETYMARTGTPRRALARVAEKNHRNGASNPFAHRQKLRSIDDILAAKPIAGVLTSLECCPVGEGAAAVIVASDEAITRLGLNGDRAIRVAASSAASEAAGGRSDAALVQTTIGAALAAAKRVASDLDVVEFHDAFSVEELIYTEAAGLAPAGQAAAMLEEGVFDIGGRCAVSASGGLIAMGHPIGPTGIGQIAELVMQLRGEGGVRQHRDARIGLAQMVGIGPVGFAHVLERP